MISWLRRLWRTSGISGRNEVQLPLDTPRPDPEHRIYAVGDVHGRHDLLEALLWRLKQDAAARTDERIPILVFLGDLVDRGDHSREVLDQVMAAWLSWSRTVVLRGNHEDALLTFLDQPDKGKAWLEFGGKQTLGSYGINVPTGAAAAGELRDTAQALARSMGHHAHFLRDQTERMFISGRVVLSHAGVDPKRPLGGQSDDALLWGRSTFLKDGPPEGIRSVHGHWDAPEPVVTPGRICVDTGAYYTGRLTAVRLDAATEVISIDGLDL